MKIARLMSMVLVLSALYACEPVTDISSDTSTSDQSVPSSVNNNSSEAFTTSMTMRTIEQNKGLAALRGATARYHDVTVEIEDGFEQILPCTENPNGEGALGVVYANLDRFDTTIDLNEPEVLFYEPRRMVIFDCSVENR